MSQAFEPLLGLARSGCAVLVLAHPPKNGGSAARGSGSLEGAVDAIVQLSREPGSPGPERRLEGEGRWQMPDSQRITFDIDAGRWHRIGLEDPAPSAELLGDLEDVLLFLLDASEPPSKNQVERQIGKRSRAAVALGHSHGLIVLSEGKRGAQLLSSAAEVSRGPDGTLALAGYGSVGEAVGATSAAPGDRAEGPPGPAEVADAACQAGDEPDEPPELGRASAEVAELDEPTDAELQEMRQALAEHDALADPEDLETYDGIAPARKRSGSVRSMGRQRTPTHATGARTREGRGPGEGGFQAHLTGLLAALSWSLSAGRRKILAFRTRKRSRPGVGTRSPGAELRRVPTSRGFQMHLVVAA